MNDNAKPSDTYTSDTKKAMTAGFEVWLHSEGAQPSIALMRSAYLAGWYDGAKDMAAVIKREMKND